MITDNQAKEAIKTIAEYCYQHNSGTCDDCKLHHVCLAAMFHGRPPISWPDHLEE